MRRLLVAALTVLIPLSSKAANTELAPERVVFNTTAGDLVFVLYPKVAPKTVAQFLTLVRAGVYNGTHFVRVHPGFVAQLSTHLDRATPLSTEQQSVIQKIPAEFSDLLHERGVLSMAREDGDINSAETSFSILLGPAPHLDRQYTIFGRLEQGGDVLNQIVTVPRDSKYRPAVRLEVTSSEVLPNQAALDRAVLQPARAVPLPYGADRVPPVVIPVPQPGGNEGQANGREVAMTFAFVCLLGLISFFLQGRVPAGVHASLNLAMVLTGAFGVLLAGIPEGHKHPWLGAVLFFGLIGVFRALGKFEQPAPVRK